MNELKDYSRRPTKQELEMISNAQAIDARSSKGWGSGGIAKKNDHKYTNQVKAEVYNRIFGSAPQGLSLSTKEIKEQTNQPSNIDTRKPRSTKTRVS